MNFLSVRYIVVCTQINILQPPSVLFQFNIIIKSANKEVLIHQSYVLCYSIFYPYRGMDNQIFKDQYTLKRMIV